PPRLRSPLPLSQGSIQGCMASLFDRSLNRRPPPPCHPEAAVDCPSRRQPAARDLTLTTADRTSTTLSAQGLQMAEPIDAVLVGAGNRGHFVYGGYARRHPDELRFVALAEPDEGRRRRFAEAHAIPPERQFASWEALAQRPRLAPALVNATMDGDHFASGVAFL